MNAYRIIVLTASLLLTAAAPLTAASTTTVPTPKATAPITATLTGLGCATSIGDDSFEARSWSWGATNTATDVGSGGGAGKAVIAALTLSRLSDACSPNLLSGVVTGKHFPTFTLSQFDKDGVLTATVVLTDAILTSWQVGGTNTSSEAAEEVHVSFKKLTFTDVASGNKFSWDVAASKSF